MATIKLISEQEASAEVKEIFEDVKQHFNLDFVPEIFRAIAKNPQLLKEQWEGMKQAEEAWGKENFYLLGLAVDIINDCEYCIDFDTAMLKQLGWDDAKIEQLVTFVSMANMYNSYASGLRLKSDVTPEVVEKRMAA